MPPPDRALAWELSSAHLAPARVALYRELGFDVVMGHRRGARFWDLDGERSWIDCHTNGGVFALGHRHPRVVAAVEEALASLDIGNHHLVSPWRAELARRLAATTGNQLPGVVFGSSGGESVDLALATCRGATGRSGIVSAVGGYHGHTGFARSTGDDAFLGPLGPRLPGFRQVPFGDLAAMDVAIGDETAAVILEPIPATLGMPVPPPSYLPGVARLCAARGARLVLDEVQCGLGRTGHLWAFQHDPSLRPDAIVVGKGLSGGLIPITATLLAADVFAHFAAYPFAHVSTFGGSELGCAAALAVLDTIESPGFLGRVEELGRRFERELSGLAFDLRRLGMMIGLAFPSAGGGVEAARRLLARGVFAAWAANDDAVLQLMPPLVLDDAEATEVIAAVRGAFA